MNKLIKSIALSAIVLGTVFVTGNLVSAQSNNAELCTRTGLPLSEYGGKNFTVNGNKITAKFKLTGSANCKYDMTLAVFEGYEKTDSVPPFDRYFDFDIPRESQKLFSAVSKTVTGPGTHTLETTIPECIYQADVITGKAIKSEVGTGYFQYINNENFINQGRLNAGNDTAHVHDATFGGKDVCKDVEEPEPCPIDPSMPIDDPNCKEEEEPETPVDPEMPDTPKTPETPITPAGVKTLPSTGAGSVIASILGLSSSTGLAYNLILNRKKLL